jgi:dTDP-glucose 4,6-dehydratase
MESVVFKNKSSNEEHTLNPSSYYSASKAAADLLVKACHRTYGLPYLITRTCNNFGEHQFKEKFLPVIYNSIKDGKKIPVYGDGKQSREWIYVYDNVRIIAEFMFNEHIINDTYNIGSNIEFRNIEIIQMIQEILPGNQATIEFVPDRLGHDRVYRLDLTKLKHYFAGFDIAKSFLHIKDYLKNIYGSGH